MRLGEKEKDGDLDQIHYRVRHVAAETIGDPAPKEAAEPVEHCDETVNRARRCRRCAGEFDVDWYGIRDDQDTRGNVQEQQQPEAIELQRMERLSRRVAV